jgi:hypothetical protein
MKNTHVKIEGNKVAFTYDDDLNRYDMFLNIAWICMKELARTKPGRKKLNDLHVRYLSLQDDLAEIYLEEEEKRRIRWEEKRGK